jgi:glycosyltransferase involved in cell wall biosynthesis
MTLGPALPNSRRFPPTHHVEDAHTLPRVVAVITAFRSADYVERAMKSLKAQDYPYLDCYLIDDASPDGTYPVASEIAVRLGGYTVLQNEANRGLSGSLNRALEFCRQGDLLFVHHDDIILSDPRFISRAVIWFRDQSVALVTGQPIIDVHHLNRARRIFSRLLFTDYVDERVTELAYSLLKADTIRASALRQIGGFAFVVNRSLGLEDKLLGSSLMAAGYRSLKDPDLKYQLDFARTNTIWSFLAKEYDAGRTLSFAVVTGVIAIELRGGEIAIRGINRVAQILVTALLAISGTLLVMGRWTDAAIAGFPLVARGASLVWRGSGLSAYDRLTILLVGLMHDVVFTAGFFVGVLLGARDRLREVFH